jgi:LPXTG-motif cell wall-anchored protein
VLVKNTYDEIDIEALGSLTVHKVVAGDIDELDELPEFIFTVTGPNGFTSTKTIAGGESYTWTELEAGTYTVTEDKTKLGKGWTVKGEGSVEVEDDMESEITVTNTYDDLPDTGGDPVTMILSGMMLAGAGALIRRRRK